MDERDTPALATGTSIDGAVVEQWVGAGGYGSVYRARDRRSGRQLAFKFISLARAGARAYRECSVSLHFQHPNLVHPLGSGVWPPVWPRFLWLKMLYIRGRALDVWASETNPTARTVVRKVLGVTRALTVVHAQGVVHRDVKEANILVRESDGESVLLDFGAAKGEHDSLHTQDMFPPGTPLYRSPEAWRFAREHAHREGAHYQPGKADDLYALGVVLYRLLTGTPPFRLVPDEGQSLQALLHEPPLSPRLLNPRVPEALSHLCLKLLEKTPEARHASALALHAALEALLAGADADWDVPLRVDGTPKRGRRGPERGPRRAPSWRHVHRARAAMAGGGVAALVLAGVGLAGWHIAQTRDSPDTLSPPSPTVQRLLSREMAPTWPPLEAVQAVTAPVARLQEDALKKKPVRSSMIKVCIGATAAAHAACQGAPVRPTPAPAARSNPAPEDCPEGSWENMWGPLLDLNQSHDVYFLPPNRIPEPVPVREGPISALVAGRWGKLKGSTVLKGRLLFGDHRIYGRFTEVETPEGNVQVCLNLVSSDGPGAKMQPGSTKDHVLLFSTSTVKAVKRFE